jgi:hypothetical protein
MLDWRDERLQSEFYGSGQGPSDTVTSYEVRKKYYGSDRGPSVAVILFDPVWR